MFAQRRPGAIAEAALLVGALLFVCSRGDPEPPGPCRGPLEHRARAGWTVEVRCGGDLQPTRRALRGPARLLFGQTLDLNRADVRSMESLPGIGPRRAHAIGLVRCQRAFESLADLERVPGIGPRTVSRLLGWAHVGPPVEGWGSGVGCRAERR